MRDNLLVPPLIPPIQCFAYPSLAGIKKIPVRFLGYYYYKRLFILVKDNEKETGKSIKKF